MLCTFRASAAYGEGGMIASMDPLGLQFLNRMCREYPVSVVISSTWRKGRRHRLFYELFGSHGYTDLAKAIYYTSKLDKDLGHGDAWRTPTNDRINSQGFRGADVEEWLEHYEPKANYIIIDDGSDFFENQKEFFVQTAEPVGMSLENFDEIENLLKKYTK